MKYKVFLAVCSLCLLLACVTPYRYNGTPNYGGKTSPGAKYNPYRSAPARRN